MCDKHSFVGIDYARKQGVSMEEVENEKQSLSSDLKVACEIWHFNMLGKPIWFGKLAESLAWCMSEKEVSHSIDTLFDWVIIYGEYGETENGRAGYCFHIDTKDGGDPTISELYEAHWKQERRRNANIESENTILSDSVR